MFTGIHFIPADTKIGFVRLRTISWVISALLTVVPLLLVWKVGINFGIDFQGGTLISTLVLFWLGSGAVRGFAVTLTIGILASMFTAVTLTRLMVSYWLRWARPALIPI